MSASTVARGEPHATPALTVAAIGRPSTSAAAAAKAARTRHSSRVRELARYDSDELFAAEPADDVVGAHGFPRYRREQMQDAIADRVTPPIVDRFEMIEVEGKHADWSRAATITCHN